MSIQTGPTWTTYIIESSDGLLYTGITTDPPRRFKEHATKRALGRRSRGAKFFLGREPLRFCYLEACQDRAAASRREYQIKAMSREEKQAMIRHWLDIQTSESTDL